MMRKSTTFLAFTVCFTVAVCSASASVSQECQEGEKFWCQNLLSAKRCGAVKHCQAVWGGRAFEVPSCHAGQLFVKKAQLQISHLNTNAAKLNEIAGLCNELDDQLRLTCKSLMVEAGPDALQMINSTMRPATIGDILGLCATASDASKKRDSKICDDCKNFFHDVEDSFIGPHVQDMMKRRMEQLCKQVPDNFFDMCISLSENWVKHFFQYMNEEVKFDQVCGFMHLCTDDEEHLFNLKNVLQMMNGMSNPLSDMACNTCKQIMDDVRDLINSQSFQTETEDFISQTMCNLMPQHLVGPCKNRVRKYGNLIFDIIVAGFDSQVTCEAVRMCPQSEVGLKSYDLKASMLSVARRVRKEFSPATEQMVANVENVVSTFGMYRDILGGGECTLCELVFKEVERMIGDDASESQITSALDEACNLLPPPWSGECSLFIQQNGRQIIDDILRNLPPRQVCFSFGFCSSDKARVKRDVTIYVMSEKDDMEKPKKEEKVKDTTTSSVRGSPWCQICNQIGGIVQRILSSQQLEVGVDTIYSQVCDVFPKHIASTCIHVTKMFIDGVLGGVSTVAQPEVMCGAIGVCDFQLTPMNYSVPVPDALKPRH